MRVSSPLPQPQMRPVVIPNPVPTQVGVVEEEPVSEVPVLKALLQAKREALPPPLPPTPPPSAQVRLEPPVPKAKRPKRNFEQEFGQVWVARIGIGLLLTGLVLGANWAYHNWIHHLHAGTKLAALYVCSLLIGGPGLWLARKDGYKRYGEVLVAGGLAFFYYCTYAAHQVEALRVIQSPVTAAVLLFGAAGLIAAVSWVRNSPATAVMGIVLASYATMVQPLDWLAAGSNLMLAAMGIGLMLRPGWKAPGIASLAGTYLAFSGWQVLGAAGHGTGDVRATLCFLAGSWAIFAVPGMLGRFREAIGDRGRAFFTAANNGAFLLIFSMIWVNCYGQVGFWQVPAVFGAVLLGMGMVGRKREDSAAASNVIQALACLSLALVLKFEGYHLALALAGESLALALAFHRFRKWAELVFSLLAGASAAVMSLALHLPQYGSVPLWSGALAAIVVALAAVVVRWNVERTEDPGPAEVRLGASLLAYSSLGILIAGWGARLPDPWQLPVAAGLSAAFAAVSLLVDRRRWMPELAWGAAILGLFTIPLLDQHGPLWGQGLALAATLGSCVLWHRLPEGSASQLKADPFETPQPFAWLFAGLVPAIFLRMAGQEALPVTTHIVALAIGATALVAIARATKAGRLEITAPFLNIGALLLVIQAIIEGNASVSKVLSFTPAAAAAVILLLVSYKRDAPLLAQVMITRLTLFVAWAAALMFAVPTGFIDLMALSAMAAFAVAWKKKQIAPVDAWGWTLLSLLIYLEVLGDGTGSRFHGFAFEGLGLVALLSGIAMWTPKLPASLQRSADESLPWLACGMVTLWSTHITVDEFGWKGVAVLWTLLGFGLVSFGLVFNRITSRKTGFILLALALLKLFTVDVWDFTTFMRVVSFIALGLALVLLGLFYHRFAPALKRLIDEEKA